MRCCRWSLPVSPSSAPTPYLSSTRLRGSLRDQIGEQGFLLIYSLTGLVTFAWFVLAYARAPFIPVWTPPRWAAYVPIGLMPLATLLLVSGYSTPNPTAVGMERSVRADDPAPGIMRVTRHPVMWAIGLWALGHLAANGDLGSIWFFGVIGALALGGTVLIDRKKRVGAGQPLATPGECYVEYPVCRLGDWPNPIAVARYRGVAAVGGVAAIRCPVSRPSAVCWGADHRSVKPP